MSYLSWLCTQSAKCAKYVMEHVLQMFEDVSEMKICHSAEHIHLLPYGLPGDANKHVIAAG